MDVPGVGQMFWVDDQYSLEPAIREIAGIEQRWDAPLSLRQWDNTEEDGLTFV